MEQVGKPARKIRPSAGGIGVFFGGIIIGLAVSLFLSSARSASSLTSGLPSGWGNASSQFDARIRSRFPIGSSAQNLIDGLGAEGFKPTWFETEGEYGAKRDEGSFVCNVADSILAGGSKRHGVGDSWDLPRGRLPLTPNKNACFGRATACKRSFR
jgi:hypothetical protein